MSDDSGYETDKTEATVLDSEPNSPDNSPPPLKKLRSQFFTPKAPSPKGPSGATLSTDLTDKQGNIMYTKDGNIVTSRNNIPPYYNGPLSDKNREIIPQTKLWGGKKSKSRKMKKTKKSRKMKSRKMKKTKKSRKMKSRK